MLGNETNPENPEQFALHLRGSLEKTPFKGQKVIQQEEDGSSYVTKDYSSLIRFDSCPLRCPDMSTMDLLPMAA